MPDEHSGQPLTRRGGCTEAREAQSYTRPMTPSGSGAVAWTLTDETGQTATLRPGDSYLIKQDSLIRWHVARSFVQKSFFSVVEE